MLRFLLRPQWVALTLVCLLLLPAFKALSDWQWRRLHQRQAWNDIITSNQTAPPIDVSDLPPSPTDADQWRIVRACGSWEATTQVLVRQRPYQARQGFWVVTALRTAVGDFVIVRGWVAAGETSQDTPSVAAPPPGYVCTESRFRVSTPRSKPRPADLPVGQVDMLVPLDVSASAYPGGYGELVSSEPDSAEGLLLLLAPEVTEGPHRSYALQWLVFMVLTVVGWVTLVRAEVQRESSAN